MGTVRQAQERTGDSVEETLAQLGLPVATYYRWQAREQAGCLADRVVVPRRRVPSPTPAEGTAVRHYALTHTQTGYKPSDLADGGPGRGLPATVPSL